MKNYFIIHGTFGSNIENWFPWLKEQIDNESILCTIPQFPINNLQNYENWKNLLDYYYDLNMIGEDTIFIAHSIGCIFVVKYLIEKKININKLVLVSGFNNYYKIEEFDQLNKSFFISDDNISEINTYAKEIICTYSDNDPYISLEELKRFSKSINAKEVLIKDGGHFNKMSGYLQFDQIKKYL